MGEEPSPARTIRALSEALRRERAAIGAFDIPLLIRIAEEKETLLKDLIQDESAGSTDIRTSAKEELLGEAEANRALLLDTLRCVAEILGTGEHPGTYDARARQRAHVPPRAGRRA